MPYRSEKASWCRIEQNGNHGDQNGEDKQRSAFSIMAKEVRAYSYVILVSALCQGMWVFRKSWRDPKETLEAWRTGRENKTVAFFQHLSVNVICLSTWKKAQACCLQQTGPFLICISKVKNCFVFFHKVVVTFPVLQFKLHSSWTGTALVSLRRQRNCPFLPLLSEKCGACSTRPGTWA